MTTEVKAYSAENLALAKIRPSPYQPREGEDETLAELAESLRTQGQLQPIQVRTLEDGGYECVFGHRRIDAAASLGWKEISAVVTDITPQEAADRLLEENLRRADLTATEKARFLRRYQTDFELTQTQVGERFGIAQETVSNYLRLLNVPEEVQKLVDEGRLTGSHVKEILRLPEAKAQVKTAQWAAAPEGSAPEDRRGMTVNSTKWHVDSTLNQRKEREANRERTENIRDVEGPKLGDRLTKGLKPTDDPKVPYRDDESGLPLLFAGVRVKGLLLRPAKPPITQKEYDPVTDPALRKELDALGVRVEYRRPVDDDDEDVEPVLDYNQRVKQRYTVTTALKEKLGASHRKPCPCGGEHVAVRGWGVETGLPEEQPAWNSYDTKTGGAPKTVIYCSDPKAVNLTVARHFKANHDAERDRQRQDGLAFERFLEGPALKGGPQVAAFLIGCASGDFEKADKALTHPGPAWVELCRGTAREFTRYRNNPGATLQHLLQVVTGEVPPKKGKKGKGG